MRGGFFVETMTYKRGGCRGLVAWKQKEKRGFHNVTLCGWYCAPSYRQVYQSWQRLRVVPQHTQFTETEHIRTPTCTHTLVQVCIYENLDTSTIRYQRKYFTACADSWLHVSVCATLIYHFCCVSVQNINTGTLIQLFQFYTLVLYVHTIYGCAIRFCRGLYYKQCIKQPPYPLYYM